MGPRAITTAAITATFALSAGAGVLVDAALSRDTWHARAPTYQADQVGARPSGADWAAEAAFIAEQNHRRTSGHALTVPGRVSRAGPVRVLLVGDSWMAGDGLVDTQSWVGPRLQRELGQTVGPGSFRVTTWARPAASTMEQAQWLESGLLDRLDPEVIVIAQNPNDLVPSGREDLLCPRARQPCQDLVAEMSSQYRDCLREHEQGLAAGLGLDALAGETAGRRCDPRVIAERTGMLTFDELIGLPRSTPYWKPYLEAVAQLAALAQQREVIVAPVDPGSGELLDAMRAAGLDVADLGQVQPQLQRMRADKSAWANPGDPHPGPAWTQAYARAVAAVILEAVPEARIRQARLHADPGSSELVVGHLPADARLGASGPQAVLEVPATLAPCLPLGHPHALVSLNPGLADGTSVTVHLQDGPAVTAWAWGYDLAGDPVRSMAGRIEPGGRLTIRTGPQVRGLSLAQGPGCERPAHLQAMRVSLQVP